MTNIYPDSLSEIAIELIITSKRRGFGIATAESCTGGLIAGLLTSISGSSAVFECGFITYSNNSKKSRSQIYLTYNKEKDGKFRSKYISDKRKTFPPNDERLANKKYSYKV